MSTWDDAGMWAEADSGDKALEDLAEARRDMLRTVALLAEWDGRGDRLTEQLAVESAQAAVSRFAFALAARGAMVRAKRRIDELDARRAKAGEGS